MLLKEQKKMLKQVFSKLFTGKTTDKPATGASNTSDFVRYERPPIYAIPTISSCFQQHQMAAASVSAVGSDTTASSINQFYSNKSTPLPKLSNMPPSNNNNNNNNPFKSSHQYHHKSSSSSSSSTSSSSSSSSSGGGGGGRMALSSVVSLSSKSSTGAKFNTPNIQQIYIAPHCIRYTNSTLDDTVYRIDDESLNEIASEILEAESVPPKLQIVFYANRYYAINNSHLQVTT